MNSDKKYSRWLHILLLILAGILLNWIFPRIVTTLDVPLYIDSVGTLLAGILTGYLPAIFVAFVTNIINGLYDDTTVFYVFINVLLAIAAVQLKRRGFFSKILRIPITILILGGIGGIVGSIVTWCLYNLGTGAEKSAALAKVLLSTHKFNAFFSQFFADLWIDIADKGVTVLLALALLMVIPRRLKHYLGTLEEWSVRGKTKNYTKRSLRTECTFIILMASLFICFVASGISYWLYIKVKVHYSTELATSIAKQFHKHIPADKIDYYLKTLQKDEEYENTIAEMKELKDTFKDIKFIYVYQIKNNVVRAVFDIDSGDVPADDLGATIIFDEAFRKYQTQLENGESIPPVRSHDNYGWLLTVYVPIFNSSGAYVAYTCIDISMGHVLAECIQHLMRIFSLLFGAMGVICISILAYTENKLIRPINNMANASRQFITGSHLEALNLMNELEINFGNEIENLYNAIRFTAAELTRNENERQLLLNNIDIPLILYATDGKIILANKSYEKWIKPEDCDFNDVHNPAEQAEGHTCVLCSSLKEQRTITAENTIGGRDYRIVAQPIFNNDGSLYGSVLEFNDITESNRAAQAKARAFQLEQDTAKRKNLFLSSINHEIKTPLNAIVGYSEILQQDKALAEKTNEYANTIHASAMNMATLLDSLTIILQPEATTHSINPTNCDLRKLLAGVNSEESSIFQDKNNTADIVVAASVPAALILDETLLAKVLHHLLNNAYKYTDNGKITLSASWQNDTLTLTCADTGVGIPLDEQPKLFEAFFQVDVERDEHKLKGKGIGLAIVKNLVQRMGGAISISSDLGKGSAFTIVLNGIQPAANINQQTKVTLEEFTKNLNVLIVDDMALNVKVLTMLCSRIGLKTYGTTEVSNALDYLTKTDVSLILTDMWMPEMNGAEFADKVRTLPHGDKIEICAITADPAADQNFNTASINEIYQKPVSIAHLKDIVAKLWQQLS